MHFRAFGLVVAVVACAQPATSPTHAHRHLDGAMQGWLAPNRARIDRLLDEGGGSRVAVFDWDNTMMRNDIGDATFFWMLRHDEIVQPPDRDWSLTNKHLTTAARQALAGACDSLAEPGKPLPTSQAVACADALVAIYDRGVTPKDAPAFDDDTTETIHQPYAWGAQLQAAHTPSEMRAIAEKAYAENAAAEVSATQTIGTTQGLAHWVRIYEPMHDLVSSLQANGFDVWVVSASSQPLAETVASKVGVDASHVIGVRTVVRADGRLDYRLRGCATEPDGADTVITYDRGKRCWINREIFHLPPSERLDRARDPHMRPAFAAGDSDTDLAMVEDATELKLVINRNRPLLMCNAYTNKRGRWLIQPMFIQPLPRLASGYACSKLVDHAGRPATDEDGNAMSDQTDTVH